MLKNFPKLIKEIFFRTYVAPPLGSNFSDSHLNSILHKIQFTIYEKFREIRYRTIHANSK